MTFVLVSHIREKFLVIGDRKFVSLLFAVKTHVIWMGIQQGHASPLSYPIQLLLPNIDVPLAKNHEKCEVLNQGVWELYIPPSIWARHPERKNRSHSVWLRLEAIRVKRGSIVFHT